MQFLAEYPALADHWVTGADEQLAAYLGLNREASVRFWRLKAMEVWPTYIASKNSQNAARGATGNDGVNDGDDAGTSEDETPEHTASGYSQQTSTILGKDATRDEGKEQSERARKISSRATTRDGSATPLSVTVKEAATMLGLSESYVRELRNNKRLHSSGRNKKLLLVSSIKAYQETHQKPELNEQHTYQENELRYGNGNGDVEVAVSLGEYPHVTV